jgi:hypothetical protein
VTDFLYVSDDAALAHCGQDTTLADAQTDVTARAEDAQLKQESVTAAQARTATLKQGRAGLHERLEKTRADLKAFSDTETEAALEDFATADHAANAETYSHLAQGITWLTACLATCDSLTMPAQILAQWRTEADLLRSMGNLCTARAIEQSVKRNAAAQALLESEGVVTFSGATGRSHDLLVKAWSYHRRSSEVETMISNEKTRVAQIKQAEK